MLEWVRGFMGGEEQRPELQNHSPLWKEKMRSYFEKPIVSPHDLARNVEILNTAVAEHCARRFTESMPEKEWMMEWKENDRVRKPMAGIRSRFMDWALEQKFQDDETHLMWKFLCQEYYQEEVRSFVDWMRGTFEDAVTIKKMKGKLRDHADYVEGGFEEWRQHGAGAQYILTEQDEYYCWQGVEWQLFNARDVGKRLGSEVQ